jgi:hypothetical protein
MGKNVTVTHVGASSIGRLVGTVNAIVALAGGIIGSLATISSIVSSQNYSLWQNIGLSALIVAGGIIVLPLLAFVFGWLYGALVGVIWNVLLGASGGLDMTIEDVVDKIYFFKHRRVYSLPSKR